MGQLVNGVWNPDYLAPLESAGDYLVVMPASTWIGYSGRQWIASGLLDNIRAAAREFKRRTGNALVITEVWRSLATQKEMKRRQLAGTGNAAATPGWSKHGLGFAVDFGSGIGYGGEPYRIWAEIAADYGWSNEEGLGAGERWHWTGSARVVGAGGTATPIEEDELNQTEKDQLRYLFEVIQAAGPDNGGVPLRLQIGGAFRDAAAARQYAEAAAIDAYAARKLSESVFEAVFAGGDSMPDKIDPNGPVGRSIGQSLAEIRTLVDRTQSALTVQQADDVAAGRPSLRDQIRNVYDGLFLSGSSIPNGNIVSMLRQLLGLEPRKK